MKSRTTKYRKSYFDEKSAMLIIKEKLTGHYPGLERLLTALDKEIQTFIQTAKTKNSRKTRIVINADNSEDRSFSREEMVSDDERSKPNKHQFYANCKEHKKIYCIYKIIYELEQLSSSLFEECKTDQTLNPAFEKIQNALFQCRIEQIELTDINGLLKYISIQSSASDIYKPIVDKIENQIRQFNKNYQELKREFLSYGIFPSAYNEPKNNVIKCIAIYKDNADAEKTLSLLLDVKNSFNIFEKIYNKLMSALIDEATKQKVVRDRAKAEEAARKKAEAEQEAREKAEVDKLAKSIADLERKLLEAKNNSKIEEQKNREYREYQLVIERLDSLNKQYKTILDNALSSIDGFRKKSVELGSTIEEIQKRFAAISINDDSASKNFLYIETLVDKITNLLQRAAIIHKYLLDKIQQLEDATKSNIQVGDSTITNAIEKVNASIETISIEIDKINVLTEKINTLSLDIECIVKEAETGIEKIKAELNEAKKIILAEKNNIDSVNVNEGAISQRIANAKPSLKKLIESLHYVINNDASLHKYKLHIMARKMLNQIPSDDRSLTLASFNKIMNATDQIIKLAQIDTKKCSKYYWNIKAIQNDKEIVKALNSCGYQSDNKKSQYNTKEVEIIETLRSYVLSESKEIQAVVGKHTGLRKIRDYFILDSKDATTSMTFDFIKFIFSKRLVNNKKAGFNSFFKWMGRDNAVDKLYRSISQDKRDILSVIKQLPNYASIKQSSIVLLPK